MEIPSKVVSEGSHLTIHKSCNSRNLMNRILVPEMKGKVLVKKSKSNNIIIIRLLGKGKL